MKSLTMKVEGMSCNGCAERIRSTVAAQAGVQTTVVSFDEGQALVLFDPLTIDENLLVGTVQKLGFRVVGHTAA